MFFEGLAGCVRERKMYQKTSKMISKSIPKSMKNRSRIYARKSDTQNIKKTFKMELKRDPKTIKNTLTNRCRKCLEKEAEKSTPGSS